MRHEFRHGTVPMYLVRLARPAALRTGERACEVLLWESQVELRATATAVARAAPRHRLARSA